MLDVVELLSEWTSLHGLKYKVLALWEIAQRAKFDPISLANLPTSLMGWAYNSSSALASRISSMNLCPCVDISTAVTAVRRLGETMAFIPRAMVMEILPITASSLSVSSTCIVT